MDCRTCHTPWKDGMLGFFVDGLWECSNCQKCWVCQKSLFTGIESVALSYGNWVHAHCRTCNCGEPWRASTSVVRTNGSRRICSYCNGCECNNEACLYKHSYCMNNFRSELKQIRGENNPRHVLVLVGEKLLVDVHRPCGSCGGICEREDMLDCENPPPKKNCDKCGKCLHVEGSVCPYYPMNGTEDPVGHRSCVNCSVCGESAANTPKTRDVWVEKDGIITHAGCFVCEDECCGKAIATQKIVKDHCDTNVIKYVHLQCFNANKRKRKFAEKEAIAAEKATRAADNAAKKRKVNMQ